MKNFLLAALFAILCLSANSQVTNRCLKFTKADNDNYGTVDCGPMPSLNGLDSYTVQFWMNPSEWKYGQDILRRGNFRICLGAPDPGAVIFSVDGTELRVSTYLTTGSWNQLTLIVDQGNPTILLNGEVVQPGSQNSTTRTPVFDFTKTGEKAPAGKMPAIPSDNTNPLKLGGAGANGPYIGLLDEVRIWKCALPDEFDRFVFNTLNKFAPEWDNLLVYYKMDQPGEATGKKDFYDECLVDYHSFIDSPNASVNNHGILSKNYVEFVNVEGEYANDKMPYLFHGAYTEDARFFDRIIPRNQYLLSNTLIILGANIEPDKGTCVLRTPNTHATIYNGSLQTSSDRGSGVVVLEGSPDSYVECPAETLTLNDDGGFAFETWMCIDEWPAYDDIPDDDTENVDDEDKAYILKKENTTDNGGYEGIAVYLGREVGKLIVRINGTKFVHRFDEIVPGEWVYFAICPDLDNNDQLLAYVNGKTYDFNKATGAKKVTFDNDNTPTVFGKNLKCKLDNTLIWNRSWRQGMFYSHMIGNGLMPMIGQGVNNLTFGDVFLRYDNEENLGYNSFSNDEWLRIMKSAYDGYAGYKICLSVRGETSNQTVQGPNNTTHPIWWSVFYNAEYRKKFIADFVKFAEPYDGVEFDCEWDDNWWQLSETVRELRGVLDPSKTIRVSCHSKYYNYTKDNRTYVDGFTFQMYGPDSNLYSFNNQNNSFTKSLANFINPTGAGFDKNKILTSYATTTNNGSGLQNEKDNILETADYSYKGEDAEADQTSVFVNSKTHYYMTPGQAYKRAKHTREQGVGGIFYWDMGNEYWGNYTDEPQTAANASLIETYSTPIQEVTPDMPKYNLAKYANYAISANVDPIMSSDNVKVSHYTGSMSGTESVEIKIEENALVVTPSPATDFITVTVGGVPANDITIYSTAGQTALSSESALINVTGLASGVYMVVAKDANGNPVQGKFAVK